MTETIENTDTGLTVLINWEDELSCEGYSNTCPNEVAWKATAECRCEFLLCDKCKNIAEKNNKAVSFFLGQSARCYKCNNDISLPLKRTFVPV